MSSTSTGCDDDATLSGSPDVKALAIQFIWQRGGPRDNGLSNPGLGGSVSAQRTSRIDCLQRLWCRAQVVPRVPPVESRTKSASQVEGVDAVAEKPYAIQRITGITGTTTCIVQHNKVHRFVAWRMFALGRRLERESQSINKRACLHVCLAGAAQGRAPSVSEASHFYTSDWSLSTIEKATYSWKKLDGFKSRRSAVRTACLAVRLLRSSCGPAAVRLRSGPHDLRMRSGPLSTSILLPPLALRCQLGVRVLVCWEYKAKPDRHHRRRSSTTSSAEHEVRSLED
ncbi:hypothetical protein THAOC_22230 [Thalassiosira oceanica]|uniref:Uncharacterized protein n=1 Tax=Thalassiosira oceanica TaxID=159749 RepID=K0S9W4_THAOC|nr:hypothetical protein THAOC_22230 [Thalassiosira oceanica]|eukprot:EJK57696.1 hypothetical protein THAOC_22230 [Thalassiosira oceanica]